MMRSSLLSLGAVALLATTASAQFFTPGNVVVLRVGEPTATLGSTAAKVFLDEWDTSTNTLVQSLEIPNSSTGAVPSFTQRGYSSSEGCLNVSADGRYLVLAGYDSPVGSPAPNAQPSNTTNRVVAVVDTLTGLVDTSTRLLDAFSGGTFRGVASTDGTEFWLSGSSTTGACRYTTLGATSSQDLYTSPTNTRWIGIYKGQLYTTTASTGALLQGILQVGTGLPTTAGQVPTLLPGFPTSGVFADSAPYDFWFADSNTVYVADSASNATVGWNCAGGIQKWTLSAGTWTKQYTISGFGADCIRGLTGLRRNGQTEIWFTAEPNGFTTSLFKVVDTGATSMPVMITTEAAQTDIRGVRVIGTTHNRIPGGCGTSSLDVTASGLTGTDIEVEMKNASGFPLINVSFQPLGLPLGNCTCTILFDLGVLTGASLTLPIPNNPSLFGTTVSFQGIDAFDPTTTCASPVPGLPFSTTDGVQISIY